MRLGLRTDISIVVLRVRKTIGLRSAPIRYAVTFIILGMVISSPIFMLANPSQILALGAAATPDNSNKVDSSNYHSTPRSAQAASAPTSSSATPTFMAPATSDNANGGGFTTQAATCCLTARPTNNIVNTNSFYDVVFLTATSGIIKTVQVTFPAGTTIPSGAYFNEAGGIGPGSVSKSGQTVTYTVPNAINVPAGTKIRLEFANINNPLSPSDSYKVTVTTRDTFNNIIDGPSQSAAYTIKQIGKNAIADGHITSSKPSEGFMKKVTLRDTAAGNARGWNPDGATTTFTISEPLAGNPSGSGSSAIINVDDSAVTDQLCNAGRVFGGTISIVCATAPSNGSDLDYTIINLPPNVTA